MIVEMNSSDILRALAKKHEDDVFIPECSNGPTGQNYGRLDAWAMKKSWASPLSVGYEIKVSRNDFMQDNKWHKYLTFCNQFYFVCPWGLIDKSELPDEAGLIWCTPNGHKLMTKKKSPYTKREIPENFYRSVIMSRLGQNVERRHSREERAETWRQWLERKITCRELGHQVSRKILQVVKKEVVEQRMRNDKLQMEIRELQNIKHFLDEIGVNIQDFGTERRIQKQIQRLNATFPEGVEMQLEQSVSLLNSILAKVKEGKKSATLQIDYRNEKITP